MAEASEISLRQAEADHRAVSAITATGHLKSLRTKALLIEIKHRYICPTQGLLAEKSFVVSKQVL